MANENQALALLQAAIALAGLVLIYVGFLSVKASEAAGNRSGDRFIILARFGLIPVLGGLACSIVGVCSLPGPHFHIWAATELIPIFESAVALAAIYAIIAAIMSS